ncbi:FtsL-like putative cell division protein [Parvicella tangerina]|uniref:S-adenosyl-methyltransferase n=1 Tax=Parvicella tangerina TaxID=2829795 RepID=A0A916JPN5_9FLAO|nr:FtsL-like putative cell division protein [Parvicella tangerina]CAG5085708.1 hypothetical protein CRYO30217_02847 [Parvicella tangerina]
MSEEKKNIKSVAKKLNPKGLVSGELLQDGKVLKNLPFLSYVAFLMILYIAYGYYADNTIRSLSSEEKRSDELYSELQSLMEVYNQKSLQSAVAEKLEGKKIYEAKDPPRVIWLEERK